MSDQKVSNDFNICVGVITSVNGVRGNVKIKSFTENPDDLSDFQHLFDQENNKINLSIVSMKRDCIIAEIEGVTTRNDAEKLRNTQLFIKRTELPDPDNDEFYHADLFGMDAKYEDGVIAGIIKNIVNFGAGDILEIYNPQTEKMLYIPFTKAQVPVVNILERYITIIPQEEFIAANDI